MKAHTTNGISFRKYLKSKEQRTDWLILLLSCIIGFVVIKICYPYPATIEDSATYVSAAAEDTFIFYRPFGYSFFLQIVHAFSSSIHAIFVTQILIYFISASVFAFTIKYFFHSANKWIWYGLLFFFVFSPCAFYMANTMLSDLLFAAMVYMLLAAFIFVLKKQSWGALIFFSILLLFTLHIRYSAMLFPILFIAFFVTIKGKMRWFSIAATIAVTCFFYQQIRNSMKETTGLYQFSTGFDGWQMANNGMHVIPYTDIKPEDIKDRRMQELHYVMLMHKDVILEKTSNGPTFAFMWTNELPLKQYMFYYMQQTQTPYATSWVKLGSGLYKDYGTFLIKEHPLLFMQHYYLPNSRHIFYPDRRGPIGSYTPIRAENICKWYNLPVDTNKSAKHPIYHQFVGEAITVSHLIIWIVIACVSVAAIVFRKKMKWESGEKKTFWALTIFGLLYYASTVFASPIDLRFWLPMGAIQFAFLYILLNKIIPIYKPKDSIVKQ